MHIETERKYIILKPESAQMQKCDNYESSEIEQIYLESNGATHRIRKRVFSNKTLYTETKKTRISSMSALEDEREISEEKYNKLKKNQEKNTVKLVKTRHSFSTNSLTFEIDVYPEWQNCAIMEIELTDESSEPQIPEFIKVVSEVTGKREYSNASMSRSFPKEPNV